jgi:glycosyltransferase involved in cell wall biosynthesis
MAHRLFSPFLRLPQLIHHEDGFNEDEALRLKSRRNHFRRLALGRTEALVVPSRGLESIARSVWGQPDRRVKLIYNGIDVDAYAHPPAGNAIPGFRRNPDRVVIGTLAGLRAVKNLPRLVRAVARFKDKVQLLIVGEGPEREAILVQARRCGLDALTLPGFVPDPWKYIGLFDIFALSSDGEQFPISLIEAMAAGLPAVSTDVGDVRSMLSDRNSRFIVDREDEDAYAAALGVLIDNPNLRADIGVANRAKARASYQERDMVAAYTKLYGAGLRRADLKFSMHGEENLL